MGYCFTTGVKKYGQWKFLECDGRSLKCAQDGGVVPNISPVAPSLQCKYCGEWCDTWTYAKQAVEQLDESQRI